MSSSTHTPSSVRSHLVFCCALALSLVVSFAWAGRTYQGKVVSVTDGDTIRILVHDQQLKVRLAEIDAPEKGQPWGAKARQALAEKVAGKVAVIEEIARDR